MKIFNIYIISPLLLLASISASSESTFIQNNNKEIPINVNFLTGKTEIFYCEKSATIASLKKKINLSNDKKLIFAGRTLEDHTTLNSYNIQKDSTFHVVLREEESYEESVQDSSDDEEQEQDENLKKKLQRHNDRKEVPKTKAFQLPLIAKILIIVVCIAFLGISYETFFLPTEAPLPIESSNFSKPEKEEKYSSDFDA